MKTTTKKRAKHRTSVFTAARAVIAAGSGALISTAAIMGSAGAFLPALTASLAPALGIFAVFGGTVALGWDGISVSDIAFLAASIICLLLRLMYNYMDKHRFPTAAGIVCGFTTLSGNIVASAVVGAGLREYACGVLIALFCAGAVFAFARLSLGVTPGRTNLIERDRLVPAAAFAIAAMSSWELLFVNLGVAACILLCCSALHCLKKHEAAVFCAAVSAGIVVGGVGIGLMGIVVAAVLVRPAAVGKSRRFTALYLISCVMLFSLCMEETEWLRCTLSSLAGTAAFCLAPKKALDFLVGRRTHSGSGKTGNTVSGRGTFLSAELEKLSERVSLAKGSSFLSVEDTVYAGVCINCERHDECFSEYRDTEPERNRKLCCVHFDRVIDCASLAQRNMDYSIGQENRALERRKQFSGVLAAASRAATELGGMSAVDGESVREALSETGSICREVYFAEDGSCELYYPTCERVGERRISAAFDELSDNCLSFVERKDSCGVTRLTYSPSRRYKIETSYAGIPKEESGISGDGVRFFEKGAYSYILLSDGMGTGESARSYSEFLLDSLEGLISAGYSPETAIMLSSEGLRCSSAEEGFATLSMTRINLSNGCIDFFSCGEGTNFLFEGGKLCEIPGGGYPLGLMEEPCISCKTFSAEDLTLIILLTDGASGLSASDIMLTLNELIGGELSEMAESVCGKSFIRQTDNNRDDVTVVTARVERL